MTFFSGASNVRINGGEFNIVNGNMVTFDRSRHNVNAGSFNSTNVRTINSRNNNSRQYHGVSPNNVPEIWQPGQGNLSTSSENDFDFPPPTIHPAMAQPALLPPGSRTQNINSFNVMDRNETNVDNNYSQDFGAIPPSNCNERNPGGRAGYHRGAMYDKDDDEMPANPFLQHSAPSFRNPNNRNPHSGQGFAAGPSLPGGLPYVNGRRPGTYSSAQVSPGDLQGMPPSMLAPFGEIMAQVQNLGAEEESANFQTPGVGSQEDDDSARNMSEEEDALNNDGMPDHLTNNMANLTLNEELRPAISRVKSDPQQPLPAPSSSLAYAAEHMEPRRAESAQVLPERLRYPFVNALPHQPMANVSPHRAPSSMTSAFGLNSPSVTMQGSPSFNEINGDYNKVNNSINTVNIASGNTTNTLIKDSHNDNSLKVYSPPDATTPRTKGRRR